jgi:hypothetical protein
VSVRDVDPAGPGPGGAGAGRGFSYLDERGRRITAPAVIDRIEALASPRRGQTCGSARIPGATSRPAGWMRAADASTATTTSGVLGGSMPWCRPCSATANAGDEPGEPADDGDDDGVSALDGVPRTLLAEIDAAVVDLIQGSQRRRAHRRR